MLSDNFGARRVSKNLRRRFWNYHDRNFTWLYNPRVLATFQSLLRTLSVSDGKIKNALRVKVHPALTLRVGWEDVLGKY